MNANVRRIDDPVGITTARTMPATWYSSTEHHQHEIEAIWRGEWVCVGDVDESPAPGAWRSITVGGLPVLLVRDREGVLRAFLNVCRHRAAPLCEHGAEGGGAALSCPYHAWLYRLDGSLARHQARRQLELQKVALYRPGRSACSSLWALLLTLPLPQQSRFTAVPRFT